MLRYKLRTLLILLAVGPMVLAVLWFLRQYIYEFLTEFSIPGIVGPRE